MTIYSTNFIETATHIYDRNHVSSHYDAILVLQHTSQTAKAKRDWQVIHGLIKKRCKIIDGTLAHRWPFLILKASNFPSGLITGTKRMVVSQTGKHPCSEQWRLTWVLLFNSVFHHLVDFTLGPSGPEEDPAAHITCYFLLNKTVKSYAMLLLCVCM